MDRISSTNVNYAIRAYSGTGPVTKPNGSPLPQRADASPTVAKIAPKGPAPKADPSRLVAASVGPIDLATDVSVLQGVVPKLTAAGTYSIHASAADRNTAATGVNAGRSLDVKG